MPIYDILTDRGVFIPNTSQTRADVESMFRAAFGQDMPLAPETPQGVLVTMFTQERDGHARLAAEVANQINPALANGVFLEGIGAFLNAGLRPATRTLVNDVVFVGVPGTIIKVGSKVNSNNNDEFLTIRELTIGATGQVSGSLRAKEYGPIAAPIGSLTTISTPVLGWESVTNPTAGYAGRPKETPQQFRVRREQILAINTMSVPEAIKSLLSNLEDVRSHTFRENLSGDTKVIDGVTLKPHSIWACIDGGETQELAGVLMTAKTIGAGFNGAVEITYIEPVTGQIYDNDQAVRIDRPDEITTFVRVTVAPSALNVNAIVTDAVMRYSRGELAGAGGFVVGAALAPFEISGAINIAEPSLYVRKVEVSTDAGVTWTSDEVPLDIWEVARIQPSSISTVIL